MFSLKREWINRINEFNTICHRLKYINSIIIFGDLFTVLQISDLILTQLALKNPEIREINPLYGQEWFVPVKMTMVLLIMYTMSHIPENSRKFGENAMAGMIFMYVFINMNNLYFLLSS